MDTTVESTKKIELPEFRRALEEAVTRRGATYRKDAWSYSTTKTTIQEPKPT
jgi:hypothetical protein